jgi:hypothetical protein
MGCQQSTSAHDQESILEAEKAKDLSAATYPILGSEAIMKPKGHGTYSNPVQGNLRFGCDFSTADRICNYNRHFAEHAGYFTTGRRKEAFLKEAVAEAKKRREPITFYDSNTGMPLFTAPVNRSWDDWLHESKLHGTCSLSSCPVHVIVRNCIIGS